MSHSDSCHMVKVDYNEKKHKITKIYCKKSICKFRNLAAYLDVYYMYIV